MSIQRSITKVLDISTSSSNPNEAFIINRGDKVVFTFSFTGDKLPFDISDATTARLYAKPITEKGVDAASSPLFAKEVSLSSPTNVVITVDSSSTAGNAGNYQLSILLLNANGDTITCQNIPFELYENGYAGIYTPDEDYRDEVLDANSQAQAAASAAVSAAENAVSAKEEATQQAGIATTAKTAAEAAATQAQSSATQAASDKATTETYKNAAESAKNAAELAKTQAQEISDPENRIGNLQILKQNGGQLYLNGGSATTNCKPTFGAAQSLMFTYEVSESELDASPWSIIGNAHIWSGQKGIGFAKNTSNNIQCGFNWAGNTTGRAFLEAPKAQLADGKPHAWALICGKDDTNGFFKLYRDGVLIGSKTSLALFEDFIPTYGFYFGKAQAGGSADASTKGRLSRIAFFNFDVSESDAAYTLADYQAGKSIPPSFNLTTPQGLFALKESTITSLQWYTRRADAVQYAGVWEDGAFVLKNTADTTVDAEMKMVFYIRPYITLSETIPVGALVEVSFDEWVFNTTYFSQSPETPVADVSKQRFYGWLTVGTSPEMSNFGHGKVRSDKKFRFYITEASNKLYFSNYGFALLNSVSEGDVIPANTAFWKIKGLKVKVNGAALNLENYTIARNTTTRLVKDLSAGGYDATITGEIRGDMDRRVEVFVDEIKTQIAQSTTTE